jgi:hypothetical protein
VKHYFGYPNFHHFTIALLSSLALIQQSAVCMDSGQAEQESLERQEEPREQSVRHDHPLIELSPQDQKNLEEIVEVLSQSKESLQSDLYHEDCSNTPAAQPEQIEDLEMWLSSGRDPESISAMLSRVLSYQDPHNQFYQAPGCDRGLLELSGRVKSVFGVLKVRDTKLEKFEPIREYLNVADGSPSADAAFLGDGAGKKQDEKGKKSSGQFVEIGDLLYMLDE